MSNTHGPLSTQQGFTLIELVMVIVILGVISSMVAVFMKGPIDAYFASGRRAALTDVADTTVRRMARDIRTGLPNSIRVPNTGCVEFIPTKTGGRYRADDTPAGLSFAAADTTFNLFGDNDPRDMNGNALIDQRIAVNDVVVVYNLGIAGANAYASDNIGVISAIGAATGTAPALETPISFANPGVLFPLASGGNRFQVVPGAERVVAYVCTGNGIDANGNGTGTLRRSASGNFTPASCVATGPILASNVSSCSFNYTGSDLQRNALLSMSIQLTTGNETVSLQHQVHVSNTP